MIVASTQSFRCNGWHARPVLGEQPKRTEPDAPPAGWESGWIQVCVPPGLYLTPTIAALRVSRGVIRYSGPTYYNEIDCCRSICFRTAPEITRDVCVQLWHSSSICSPHPPVTCWPCKYGVVLRRPLSEFTSRNEAVLLHDGACKRRVLARYSWHASRLELVALP